MLVAHVRVKTLANEDKILLPLQHRLGRRRRAQYFRSRHLGFPISSLVLKYQNNRLPLIVYICILITGESAGPLVKEEMSGAV